MAQATERSWSGTEDEQRAARVVYELLAASGRFYSDTAPITQRLDALVEFFAAHHEFELPAEPAALRDVLQRGLDANAAVFARRDTDGAVAYATTRAGVAPEQNGVQPNPHTYRSRLFEDAREPNEEDLKAVRGIGRELPELLLTMPEPTTTIFPDELSDDVGEEETDLPIAAYEEAHQEVEAQIQALAGRVRIGETVIDLSEEPEYILAEHGAQFKELLGGFIDEDFRFVRFGDSYYTEERVERLSKGQLREIKTYIEERGEPVTDEEILSDALTRGIGDASYDLQRFTINYRLMREKKDFRYVGTPTDRVWGTTSLAPIGQTYRKATDIAQDYRYLLDAALSDHDVVAPASGEEASGRLEMRHTLTWYESENGVLPVGPSAQLLMPNPLVDDQTTVVLRVQDPQNYATYTAELRLGAGNRGTYIAGLEELFQGTLVPGAVFSLVQGEASNEFTLEYGRQPAQEARLLQFDDRRDRWFFGPIVYECPVDPAYLLTEERVGALNGQKRASDAERKKVDGMLTAAFRLVGEPGDGGAQTALIDDLLPVLNVERPFSRQYVESLLESPQYPQFRVEDASLGLAAYAEG